MQFKPFKPTPAEWRIIKEVAYRGSYTEGAPLKTTDAVRLECRKSYNIENGDMPSSINMMITSEQPYTGCGDCDLDDCDTIYTDEFRAGAPLTEYGDGMFDFYIYNRYYRDGDLAGNVLVEVRDGCMNRIWIEGGRDWSWTPETGIVPQRLHRPR